MLCLVLKMSTQVKEVTQAMEMARKAADKAGILYHFVVGVKRQDTFWIVELRSLVGRFVVKINALNGEVVEFSRVE